MQRRRRAVVLFLGFVLVMGAWYLWREHRREHRYDREIAAAAREYRVDPALVKAVVWRESGFDAFARGSKGELGLMQMMPATAGDWVKAERVTLFVPQRLFEPATSTRAGAWYLRKLLDRYRQTDRPAVFALADYNAGRVAVLRWARGDAVSNSTAFLAAMTYPATRSYVTTILGRRERYAAEFPDPTDAVKR